MATTKRTYGDRCGVARALDIVGERWALLVVRELLLGPKRFTDLRAGLPHVGPDVLAQRLRELEAAGIVRRAHAPAARGLARLRAHRARARARAGRRSRSGASAAWRPSRRASRDRRGRRRDRAQDPVRPGGRRRAGAQLRAAPRRAALPPRHGRRAHRDRARQRPGAGRHHRDRPRDAGQRPVARARTRRGAPRAAISPSRATAGRSPASSASSPSPRPDRLPTLRRGALRQPSRWRGTRAGSRRARA